MKEGWANPDSVAIDNFTPRESWEVGIACNVPPLDDYFRKVAIPQIKETTTNYGDIAVMWWDTRTVSAKRQRRKSLPNSRSLPQGLMPDDRLRRPDFPATIRLPKDVSPTQRTSTRRLGDVSGSRQLLGIQKLGEELEKCGNNSNLNTIAARGD